MAKAVRPNGENCGEEELEGAIRVSKSKREACRLQAIKALLMEFDFAAVCKLFSVSDTTLYSWVHRFNSRGIDGLLNRERTGRPRLLSRNAVRQRLNVLEEPQLAGQTHWTAKKFHGYLCQDCQQQVSYRTAVRYLEQEDYRLKYPRAWPVKQDEEARKQFLAHLSRLIEDPDIELWFLDEAGFDGDPRARRRWGKKGAALKLFRTQKHIRMSVTGMVCPRNGEFCALEFPFSDRTTLQAFLDFANQEIEPSRQRQIVILDNASWHKVKSIQWGAFEPLFLPPYSPDLNPIERLWLFLKQTFFHSFTAKNIDELIAQLDTALLAVFKAPQIIKSVCQPP